MLGYFNIDPAGDYGGAQAMRLFYDVRWKDWGQDGRWCYVSHTICRFPGRSWVEDSWWLKPPGHYTYTLIHFSDDDPLPDPVKAAALTGWWQLDYSGRTEYYLMKAGSVTYTKKAPAKNKPRFTFLKVRLTGSWRPPVRLPLSGESPEQWKFGHRRAADTRARSTDRFRAF